MKDERTPEERGPALSYAYGTYVVARDPGAGKVLLGGLGAMGVGQMWVTERDDHKICPGYTDAAVQSSEGGFGA